jgi:TusA-related sulfurtransferase
MTDKVLDTKGLKCPMPIAEIATELKNLESGQTLEVCADDPAYAEDVKAFCRLTGNILENLNEQDNITTTIIKKK